MKYHPLPWLMAAVLLGVLPCTHADVIVLPPRPLPRRIVVQPQFPAAAGSLIFCVEQQPGKGGWATCWLTEEGNYRVNQAGAVTIQGQLTAQESHRILEEFEKLCAAAGEDRFVPAAPRAGRLQIIAPYFYYMSSQGKQLELSGPDKLPPPELTSFMRILWQKLLFHNAKNSNYHAHPSLR